jgi:hypothetical protein
MMSKHEQWKGFYQEHCIYLPAVRSPPVSCSGLLDSMNAVLFVSIPVPHLAFVLFNNLSMHIFISLVV